MDRVWGARDVVWIGVDECCGRGGRGDGEAGGQEGGRAAGGLLRGILCGGGRRGGEEGRAAGVLDAIDKTMVVLLDTSQLFNAISAEPVSTYSRQFHHRIAEFM